MKRRVLPLIIGSLLLQLGCGANDGGLLDVDEPTDPPPVLQPSELCSDNPSSAITTFSDGHLDAAVRDQLSVGAQEDLTCDLLSRLTSLSCQLLQHRGPWGNRESHELERALPPQQLDHRHQRAEWSHQPVGPLAWRQLDQRHERAEPAHEPDLAPPQQQLDYRH